MKVNLLSIYLLKERLANHSVTTGQLVGGAWGEGHGAGLHAGLLRLHGVGKRVHRNIHKAQHNTAQLALMLTANQLNHHQYTLCPINGSQHFTVSVQQKAFQ